ncbi:hypothetical protein SALBM217S_05029 [Streptomyces griseoloalbus]
MPGWTSATRRPTRLRAGPPPNCSRAALDHTYRRSVSTMAMPMGLPATICSSTSRLMSQPWAVSPSSDSSTSTAGRPCGAVVGATRTAMGTGRPSRWRAVISPDQSLPARQRASTSSIRSASADSSRSANFRPTASAAA